MKYILYYVIEKQIQTIDTIEECTGWKTIRVYEIIDNQPKLFCEIEALNETSDVEEIQIWLDNNGYEDKEFEFLQL